MSQVDKVTDSFNYDNFDSSGLTRYTPVPETESSVNFSGVLDSLGSLAGTVATVATGGIQSEFQEMIALQMYWQQQMQKVSLLSNIIKSEHETRMSAIRNVKAQ